MWPFRKSKKLFHGIKENNNGNLSFDLTIEENQAVDDFFKMYDGYGIHKDYADELKAASIAKALSNYAKEQCAKYIASHEEECISKAVASVTKAYSIYPLPIFFYDLALYLDIDFKKEMAKDAYMRFLDAQSNYVSGLVSDLIMENRNLELAIEDAKIKCK
jgi:hypothetical protein